MDPTPHDTISLELSLIDGKEVRVIPDEVNHLPAQITRTVHDTQIH